ncbi:hypothetical protein DPEC_G00252590 [Dallia pectoralis]|uniref:Uncharacterized protein n=1 Tax=Dallia pectoralis TaxID=75939 RepID=A0ACC2FTQ8_DALPE|nr:hypothetical protein DPEC_G00252590 [Dallia pectoralis]
MLWISKPKADTGYYAGRDVHAPLRFAETIGMPVDSDLPGRTSFSRGCVHEKDEAESRPGAGAVRGLFRLWSRLFGGTRGVMMRERQRERVVELSGWCSPCYRLQTASSLQN